MWPLEKKISTFSDEVTEKPSGNARANELRERKRQILMEKLEKIILEEDKQSQVLTASSIYINIYFRKKPNVVFCSISFRFVMLFPISTALSPCFKPSVAVLLGPTSYV